MLRLRTLAALTVLALCLSACGRPDATGDQAAPGPLPTSNEFVQPSEAVPPPASGTPSRSAGASPSPSTSKKATKPADPPVKVKYAFPVNASNVDYHPTHSKYPATDIFADCGAPVVATTSGVVLEISLRDQFVKGSPDGPNNGGLFVSLLGDDGVRYYGSHLSKVQGGITAGVRVTAGQRLGSVGKTGNANNVCHLHFGISPACRKVGDWKTRRGVIWPAPYLDSWRQKGGNSPVAKAASWKRANNCQA